MTGSTFTLRFPRPIPAELKKDMLGRMYYAHPTVSRLEISSDGSGVAITLKDPRASLPEEVSRKLLKVYQIVMDNYVPIEKRVLFEQADVMLPFQGDVHQVLVDGGHIAQVGNGVFVFGPLFSSVMQAFDSIFMEFGRSMGGREYTFPTLIPVKTLHRCRHFTSFPHHLTMACHLPEDIDVIEAFSIGARVPEMTRLTLRDVSVENVLSPAVCYHAYQALEGRRFPAGEAGRCVLCKGKCFRYESGNLDRVERLWDFTMREIVFIGTQEYVLDQRAKSLEWIKGVLKALQVKCRIETASDPFFVGDDMKKQLFQKALQLKYEIMLDLPWRRGSLAVGSLNYHQNFFGKTFNIMHHPADFASTGCTAFGMERFALAFLAQHGVDPAKWPSLIRDRAAGGA